MYSFGRFRIESLRRVVFDRHFFGHRMRILLHILIELIGYAVAKFALPMFSFGKIYVGPLTAPSGKFGLIGYRRDENGRIEIDSMVAGFIGLVICLIVAFGLALLIRGSL